MCYEPIAFGLAAIVFLLGVMGNFQGAWFLDDHHGGLWKYCPGKVFPVNTVLKNVKPGQDLYVKGDCFKYTKDVSENFYGQKWAEVTVAKVCVIGGIILTVPIFIMVGLQICHKVPFWAGGLFGCVQFICFLIGATMMTHGFVTSVDKVKGLQVGFDTVAIWLAALFSLACTIIMFTSKCLCWDRLRGQPRGEEDKERRVLDGSQAEQGEGGSSANRPPADESSTKATTLKAPSETTSLARAREKDEKPSSSLGSDLASRRSSQSVDYMPRVAETTRRGTKPTDGKADEESKSYVGSTGSSALQSSDSKVDRRKRQSRTTRGSRSVDKSDVSRSVVGSRAITKKGSVNPSQNTKQDSDVSRSVVGSSKIPTSKKGSVMDSQASSKGVVASTRKPSERRGTNKESTIREESLRDTNENEDMNELSTDESRLSSDEENLSRKKSSRRK